MDVPSDWPDQRMPSYFHLLGVGGSGMRSLAQLLLEQGHRVSGIDRKPQPELLKALASKGLKFHVEDDSDWSQESGYLFEAGCVVHSPAVQPDHPHLRLARQFGRCTQTLPQFLGELTKTQPSCCVAGTHGKSTTTSLLGWILTDAGRDPSVYMGAEWIGTGNYGRGGRGPWLVAECCEYRSGFLEMEPAHAVILSVEPDHFDAFPDGESLRNAFLQFARQVDPAGLLLVTEAFPDAVTVRQQMGARVETLGWASGCDWQVSQVQQLTGLWQQIRIRGPRWEFDEFYFPLPGRHNAFNAAAAIILAAEAGLSMTEIQSGLESFPGIRRRFEVRGTWRGVTVVEDYAHHPTALRSTLRTAREVYPGRRLQIVFQPHQLSRTEGLFAEFVSALCAADRVFLLPIFAAREVESERHQQVIEQLGNEVNRCGGQAALVKSLDQIAPTLDDALSPDDVLILIGAGDIDQVHYEDA